VLDDNLDGQLSVSELRGKQGEWLKASFAALDANADSHLQSTELSAARRRVVAAQPTSAPPASRSLN